MDSLDQSREWIGRPIHFEGADPVARADVRRKLEIYCFDCPLHADDTVARAHGLAAAAAPVSMTPLWAIPPYWSAGEPSPFDPRGPERTGSLQPKIPMPFSRSINTGSSWEFFEPLYWGDALRGSWTLVGIEPKQTRLGGGAFFQSETRLWKQGDVLVAINSNSNFRYDPNQGSVRPTSVERPPAKEILQAETPTAIDWDAIPRPDPHPGDVVPRIAFCFTYQRIVMSVAADRMFASIHHNADEARASGLKNIILNTRGFETISEICLRKWIGLDGRIRSLGPLKMTRNVHPGDSLSCRGRVTERAEKQGNLLVTVELDFLSSSGPAGTSAALMSLPI